MNAEANRLQETTFDYTQVDPLLEQAVAIDTTFAMAWRRLAQNYNNIGQLEKARAAAIQAYRYKDKLSEVERQLTIATYYNYPYYRGSYIGFRLVVLPSFVS